MAWEIRKQLIQQLNICICMMTAWHGNVFHITGLLRRVLSVFHHVGYSWYPPNCYGRIVFSIVFVRMHNTKAADARFAPSQWETSLQSNIVFHWLGANLESGLCSTYTSSSQRSINAFPNQTLFYRTDIESDTHDISVRRGLHLPDQLSEIYLNGDINISYKCHSYGPNGTCYLQSKYF